MTQHVEISGEVTVHPHPEHGEADVQATELEQELYEFVQGDLKTVDASFTVAIEEVDDA